MCGKDSHWHPANFCVDVSSFLMLSSCNLLFSFSSSSLKVNHLCSDWIILFYLCQQHQTKIMCFTCKRSSTFSAWRQKESTESIYMDQNPGSIPSESLPGITIAFSAFWRKIKRQERIIHKSKQNCVPVKCLTFRSNVGNEFLCTGHKPKGSTTWR